MKLSQRELVLIAVLAIAALFGLSWLLVSPAIGNLQTASNRLQTLEQQKAADQLIIDDVAYLSEKRNDLQADIAQIEERFLPGIRPESIVERLSSILEDNNIPYIVSISTNAVTPERLLLFGDEYSDVELEKTTVSIQVSGTDGTTSDDGVAIGFNEFIGAVQDIEAANPDCIFVDRIAMEDTGEGFQLFDIAVTVYSLPNRLNPADFDMSFYVWERDPVILYPEAALIQNIGMGLRLYQVPAVNLNANTFRPFLTLSEQAQRQADIDAGRIAIPLGAVPTATAPAATEPEATETEPAA